MNKQRLLMATILTILLNSSLVSWGATTPPQPIIVKEPTVGDAAPNMLTDAALEDKYLKGILIQTTGNRLEDLDREISTRHVLGFFFILSSIGSLIVGIATILDAGSSSRSLNLAATLTPFGNALLSGGVGIFVVAPLGDLGRRRDQLEEELNNLKSNKHTRLDGQIINVSLAF